VNGRIVPLDFQLANGDIVEILTSKQSNGPTADWLNFVKTSSARGRIKHWFKREKRGRIFSKVMTRWNWNSRKSILNSRELMKECKMLEVGARFSLNKADDLYAALGDGSITVNQVINKMKEMFFENIQLDDVLNVPQTTGVHRDRETSSLKIKGVDDVVIRLAHCCNPLPVTKCWVT
jgi:GTP pyrophosphokinase